MLLMEKLSAMGTLVGGVAHEINNPLMGVMNFVEFVADRSSEPKTKDILNQAMHQLQRIKNIVSNMLIFMHSKSIPTGSCSVTEVLKQTLLLLEGELRKKAISVETKIPMDLPNIACTAESLQQVLVNLLINARDALNDTENPQIRICAAAANKTVEIIVADNGPGIAEDIQSRMFDPFFTTKPPGKGTGLGLSVTQRLIQDCNGTIAVQSKIDEGCSIILKFIQNQ